MLKILLLITLTFSLSLFITPNALAEVKIDVSGNAPGAKTNVNVQRTQSSNVYSNSTTSIQTNIEVTTNGETKTYSSNSGGDIKVESSDGKAKVEVKNNISSSPKSYQKSITKTETIRLEGSASPKVEVKVEENSKFNIQQRIQEIIKILEDRIYFLKKIFSL